MKVLQVLPALNSGGVERGTLEIAEALVAAGDESWVLSAGGGLVSDLETQGSHHQQWDIGRKSPLMLLQVRPLRRWLAKQQFDVIHLRSRMPGWITWLAWRGLPVQHRPRLVTTVHGLHSVSRYSAIMTVGERVIAVSETCRRYILDNYPATDPQRIRLVYRGIDPEQFPRGYRPNAAWLDTWHQQFPQLRDRFVVTLPGRLTRLKGHLAWLEMLAQLREEIPNLCGLVVGGEDAKRRSYAQEVYRRTRELGLENQVVFAGHRRDMRDIYAVSDVIMSLSRKPESFGRTVLEPLSMGRPVVGYAHGGVAEILEALYPQGAVPLDNIEAAGQAVLAIARGGQVQVAVNERFLLARMQQQTLDIYHELLTRETSTP